jgi:RNA polymerase sigma factor (sigma-70 family)
MSDEQVYRAPSEPPNHSRGTATAPSPFASWVAAHLSDLRAILRTKVAPLCRKAQEPGDVADELLSELVEELLRTEDRFDPSQPPQFWAMKFATNVARRWQEREVKRAQREITPSYVASSDSEDTDADLYEWLNAASRDDVEGTTLGNPWVQEVLGRLTRDDHDVILALVIERRSAVDVAAEWGLTANALGVRKLRAMKRLRERVSDDERFVSGRAGSRMGIGGVG